jgi:hypothetical protein
MKSEGIENVSFKQISNYKINGEKDGYRFYGYCFIFRLLDLSNHSNNHKNYKKTIQTNPKCHLQHKTSFLSATVG